MTKKEETTKKLIKKAKSCFRNMYSRCYNKNDKDYKNYGDRDITICKTWLNNPERFVKWCLTHGIKQYLEIDRINNNKGYTPGNCRWTTHKQNMRNTRVYKTHIKIKNPVKRLKIYHREWYQEHKEEQRTYQRQWYQNNKVKKSVDKV